MNAAVGHMDGSALMVIGVSAWYPDIYVPLTMDGNIMVNGVLTSCYASSDHGLAHIALAPVRYFPEITEWIFGIQGYVSIAEDLSGWLSYE